MKKILILSICIVGISIISVLTSFKSDQDKKEFYYSRDKKIFLIPKENTLLVKYNKGFNKDSEEVYLKQASSDIILKWHGSRLLQIKSSTVESHLRLKEKIKLKKEVTSCEPFYTTENGLDMGITDEIVVKYSPNISKEEQDSLGKLFKTKLIEDNEIFQVLRVKKGDDALEIANWLYETGLVQYSHPSFITEGEFHHIPNDIF